MPQRKIIHIDADSFYASVEIRDNPSLRDKAVAVGGRPDGRGVIATCNYIARKYGIHSAMPSAHARRLCPDLIFVQPDFAKYREVSTRIREIFERYTDEIEPLSLDEAYLDVSGSTHFQGSATRIAEAIRQQVRSAIGITVSAGVAPNKFLAKIASDWRKPDGLFVITNNDIDAFMKDLEVNKINGVGKVTSAKLHGLGIHTCGQLQNLSRDELTQRFGKHGSRLFELARGRDTRPVQTHRIRKSLSIEHTYSSDIRNPDIFRDKASQLHAELVKRAEKLGKDPAIHKRVVKIKFSNFRQTTLEERICDYPVPWHSEQRYLEMLEQARQRSDQPIRLMGMGIKLTSHQSGSSQKQLELFPIKA